MSSRLILLVALLFTSVRCAPLPGRSEPVDPRIRELVSAVVDAHGGEAALNRIRGYRMFGMQHATQWNTTIQAQRWLARPDRLRLELEYPDHHETRFTDGRKGWTGPSAADLDLAAPARLQAMRLQTVRLDLPIRLLECVEDLEWRAPDDLGRPVLRLPLDDMLSMDYHIDPATHRLVHVTGWMNGPPAMTFSADYSLHHEIDGVLVPFQEVTFAGPTATSEFRVTDFQWNPPELEERVSLPLGRGL